MKNNSNSLYTKYKEERENFRLKKDFKKHNWLLYKHEKPQENGTQIIEDCKKEYTKKENKTSKNDVPRKKPHVPVSIPVEYFKNYGSRTSFLKKDKRSVIKNKTEGKSMPDLTSIKKNKKAEISKVNNHANLNKIDASVSIIKNNAEANGGKVESVKLKINHIDKTATIIKKDDSSANITSKAVNDEISTMSTDVVTAEDAKSSEASKNPIRHNTGPESESKPSESVTNETDNSNLPTYLPLPTTTLVVNNLFIKKNNNPNLSKEHSGIVADEIWIEDKDNYVILLYKKVVVMTGDKMKIIEKMIKINDVNKTRMDDYAVDLNIKVKDKSPEQKDDDILVDDDEDKIIIDKEAVTKKVIALSNSNKDLLQKNFFILQKNNFNSLNFPLDLSLLNSTLGELRSLAIEKIIAIINNSTRSNIINYLALITNMFTFTPVGNELSVNTSGESMNFMPSNANNQVSGFDSMHPTIENMSTPNKISNISNIATVVDNPKPTGRCSNQIPINSIRNKTNNVNTIENYSASNNDMHTYPRFPGTQTNTNPDNNNNFPLRCYRGRVPTRNGPYNTSSRINLNTGQGRQIPTTITSHYQGITNQGMRRESSANQNYTMQPMQAVRQNMPNMYNSGSHMMPMQAPGSQYVRQAQAQPVVNQHPYYNNYQMSYNQVPYGEYNGNKLQQMQYASPAIQPAQYSDMSSIMQEWQWSQTMPNTRRF